MKGWPAPPPIEDRGGAIGAELARGRGNRQLTTCPQPYSVSEVLIRGQASQREGPWAVGRLIPPPG